MIFTILNTNAVKEGINEWLLRLLKNLYAVVTCPGRDAKKQNRLSCDYNATAARQGCDSESLEPGWAFEGRST